MSDLSLVRRAALSHRSPVSLPAGRRDAAAVTIAARDGLALATLIAGKGQDEALKSLIAERYGVVLPDRPQRRAAGGVAFIGMAPGQWLAVAEADQAKDFVTGLSAAVGDRGAVSDQSDARAVLRIGGAKARAALAKGLPIDLHPDRFGPGDAALTVMALIGVHLWQIDALPTYDIAVFRSLADSLLDGLLAGAAEYGVDFLLHSSPAPRRGDQPGTLDS